LSYGGKWRREKQHFADRQVKNSRFAFRGSLAVKHSLDFSNRAHAGKLSARRFGVNAAKSISTALKAGRIPHACQSKTTRLNFPCADRAHGNSD
jgi:hypothetical protein